MKILMLWQVIDANEVPTTTSFYWAPSRDQALNLHIAQNYPRGDTVSLDTITVDRVWASNEDMKYRGYVAKEIK